MNDNFDPMVDYLKDRDEIRKAADRYWAEYFSRDAFVDSATFIKQAKDLGLTCWRQVYVPINEE
jgi:hypothetical protein